MNEIKRIGEEIQRGLWGEENLEKLATELKCAKTALYNIRAGMDISHCRFWLIVALMERYKIETDLQPCDGK